MQFKADKTRFEDAIRAQASLETLQAQLAIDAEKRHTDAVATLAEKRAEAANATASAERDRLNALADAQERIVEANANSLTTALNNLEVARSFLN